MKSIRMQLMQFGLTVTVPVIVLIALIPGLWQGLFAPASFMPHITCYMRNPQIVWLHVTSDTLIGLSYVCISSVLAYLVLKARHDIPFQWMFMAFGLFIVTCGLTHFMEVYTVWKAAYWQAGFVKIVCATASVITAVALPFLVPKIFLLIDTAKASALRKVQLEELNRELSDLRQRESIETSKAIKEKEERLRLAVETTGLGACDLNPRTGAWIWSDRAREILGLPGDSIVTQEHFLGRLHPEDREKASKCMRSALEPGGTGGYAVELRVVVVGGPQIRWVLSMGHAFFEEINGQKQAVRLVGTFLDITERKNSEEEVRQLNHTLEERVDERTRQLKAANQYLEDFSSSVAHDLRAPLRGMQGFSKAVLDEYGDRLDEQGRGYLHRVISAGQRMELLMQNLLDYSKVLRTAPNPMPVLLEGSVEEARQQLESSFEETKGEIEIRKPLGSVLGHPALLQQVIFNLISNGLKYVAKGVKPKIVVWSEARDGKIRLHFADNGIGVAPEYHARIFKAFERLHSREKYPGTGIGLTIVQTSIERLGGSLGLTSATGQGSTFWFELPAASGSDPA